MLSRAPGAGEPAPPPRGDSRRRAGRRWTTAIRTSCWTGRRPGCWPPASRQWAAAREIVPVSGWRSQAEQQAIWDDTLAETGRGIHPAVCGPPRVQRAPDAAWPSTWARQPRDIDFIRPEFPEDGVCGAFRRLAARYGFIQRYRPGKGVPHRHRLEPWHFRYVGAPHALLMEREGPVPGGVSGLGADSAQDVPPGTWAERTGVLHALRRR